MVFLREVYTIEEKDKLTGFPINTFSAVLENRISKNEFEASISRLNKQMENITRPMRFNANVVFWLVGFNAIVLLLSILLLSAFVYLVVLLVAADIAVFVFILQDVDESDLVNKVHTVLQSGVDTLNDNHRTKDIKWSVVPPEEKGDRNVFVLQIHVYNSSFAEQYSVINIHQNTSMCSSAQSCPNLGMFPNDLPGFMESKILIEEFDSCIACLNAIITNSKTAHTKKLAWLGVGCLMLCVNSIATLSIDNTYLTYAMCVLLPAAAAIMLGCYYRIHQGASANVQLQLEEAIDEFNAKYNELGVFWIMQTSSSKNGSYVVRLEVKRGQTNQDAATGSIQMQSDYTVHISDEEGDADVEGVNHIGRRASNKIMSLLTAITDKKSVDKGASNNSYQLIGL